MEEQSLDLLYKSIPDEDQPIATDNFIDIDFMFANPKCA